MKEKSKAKKMEKSMAGIMNDVFREHVEIKPTKARKACPICDDEKVLFNVRVEKTGLQGNEVKEVDVCYECIDQYLAHNLVLSTAPPKSVCPWKQRSTYAGTRGIDPIDSCSRCPAHERGICAGEAEISVPEASPSIKTPEGIAEMEVQGDSADETRDFDWVVRYVAGYLKSASKWVRLKRVGWVDSQNVAHANRELSHDEVYARLKTSVCAKLMSECDKWTQEHTIDINALYRKFCAGEKLTTEELMTLQMAGFL